MRWAQLTLVEDDPLHYDPAFWLDYFKRTRSDGVCLSAGGCVAFYPTEIPFHRRSTWLAGRDILGELIAGCRKLDMSILARTDPHATYDDAKLAHEALAAVVQPPRDVASRSVLPNFPTRPRYRRIALTAMAMKEDKEKSQVAGCDGYIAKPLRYAELYAVIDALLIRAGVNDRRRPTPERLP